MLRNVATFGRMESLSCRTAAAVFLHEAAGQRGRMQWATKPALL